MGVDTPTKFENWTLVGLIAVVIVAVMLAVLVVVVRPLIVRRRRLASGSGGSGAPSHSAPAVVVDPGVSSNSLVFELVDGTRLQFPIDAALARELDAGDQGMLHHDGPRLRGFDRWARPNDTGRRSQGTS